MVKRYFHTPAACLSLKDHEKNLIDDTMDLNNSNELKRIMDIILNECSDKIDFFSAKKWCSKIPNNVFDCLLRFQGKIGVAPKLINLAILLGAREVHFAGVDGHSKNYKKGDSEDHAFQKGKKITTGYAYELIEKHYECLKKYIQTEIGKNVIVKNLGEGHEQNVYSKIPDFKIE